MESLLREIAAEFDVAMGRPARVADACSRLRQRIARSPESAAASLLLELAAQLRKQRGAIACPLHDFLLEQADRAEKPWPLLIALLEARDDALVARTLERAAQLVASGTLAVDRSAALALARRVEADESPLCGGAELASIAAILARLPVCVRDVYLSDPDPPLRRLAARVLARDDRTAPRELAEQVLGREANAFLAPYLAYTGAGHLELLRLAPEPGSPPRALESFRRVEATIGEASLREVIGELGWSRVNLGLEVQPFIGISIAGSLPLMVSPDEAPLFATCEEARRVCELQVVVAHGGEAAGAGIESDDGEPIARFRALNLAHSAVLAEILDVAPLTVEKVRRIVALMDSIVEDFLLLFGSASENGALLPDVYRDLRERILSGIRRETAPEQLSAEVTRLVQAFEEPDSIGGVRSLHGLKRYLHQRGLLLGFRLMEAGRRTNRSVDLVLLPQGRVAQHVRAIDYVDFEPDPETDGRGIPHAVHVVVDAFVRQLLHGQRSFPRVRVFLYGNEVHYYASFGTHPAFIRVDYSPPLQGGMIDVEYYGVSKFDLSVHPGPSLGAIRVFFRRLDFDVRVENTRVHARYDKERALDLSDLCEKVEAVLRLVPYLMDLDWVLGDLKLGSEARDLVAQGWAESFALWGVLPIDQLLTRDRRGILERLESGPAGESEVAWSGEGAYRDRFTVPPPGAFFARLRERLEAWGLEVAPIPEEDGRRPVGQIRFEERLLRPLREAVARGEIVPGPQGLRPADPDLFRRGHEVEEFIEILDSDARAIEASARVARLLAALERSLRFRTTGEVNGHEVQRARLELRGETIGLYVLRGPRGIARLAFFARGGTLHSRREDPCAPWRSSASSDAAELASLLRRANHLPPGFETGSGAEESADELRARFRQPNPTPTTSPAPGGRCVTGLRASRGRAMGKAVFGTAGRAPGDLDGAVLVAAAVRPEDSTFLYRCAGIVSTGGGILSHAGLIALQFRKPSLIVSGRWEREAAAATVICPALEYRQEEKVEGPYRASIRRGILEREYRIHEGDLLVIDADEGTLRILGQDRDALALHEGFHALGEAARSLSRPGSEDAILTLRGERLRARHQTEKLLGRLGDPVLARHAVRELLLGELLPADASGAAEKRRLLLRLLANPLVAGAARECLAQVVEQMTLRTRAFLARAERRIPTSEWVAEILASRLELLGLARVTASALSIARPSEVDAPRPGARETERIDAIALERLAALRESLRRLFREAAEMPGAPLLRHLVRRLERLDLVLGPDAKEAAFGEGVRAALFAADASARATLGARRVLESRECGFELAPLIGWKAANLAEVARLAGSEIVPPWFVVTDRAFEEVLDSPLGDTTLRAAIAEVLARTGLDHRKVAARIRDLWDSLRLHPDLAREVLAAYHRLGGEPSPGRPAEEGPRPFLAIRSSAREEDAENAARAGEFDTFLFVRDDLALLDHLKRAWSGLWTERAIHNRAVLGVDPHSIGGGVIVQRVLWSRVSGVLQTVDVAEGEYREIVINAGLGLGEGIVSGVVAADHIVVAKEGDLDRGPLRFRYVVGDKRERVVFDARTGTGTMRSDTLYHQRLRPALEYVELCELVRVAARLEGSYGYPLDIEFAIEGTKLWILQVRPVATFLSVLRDTLEGCPLRASEEVRR